MSLPARLSSIPTPSGLPSLRVRRDEGGFLTLHSLQDPWEEACRWADKAPLQSSLDLVLVLGVGLGYPVLALADRMIQAGMKAPLWAVELDDDVLATCLNQTDLRLLAAHPGGRLLSRHSRAELQRLRQRQALDGGILILRHAPSVLLAPELYLAWEREAEEINAHGRLKHRHPEAEALLKGLGGGSAQVLAGAAERVSVAGPPYGEVEAALLLLARVLRHE